jgi:hypothetical protein
MKLYHDLVEDIQGRQIILNVSDRIVKLKKEKKLIS